MWFELGFFILAAVLPWRRKPQGFGWAPAEKGYLAVWAAAPALFVLLYRRTFSVNELLAMMLAYFLAWICKELVHRAAKLLERICKDSLHGEGKVPGFVRTRFPVSLYVPFLFKAATALCLYVWVISRYQPGSSDRAISQQEAVLFFTGISVCLFLSAGIRTWVQHKEWRIPAVALGTAVPVLGFYIVERTYNPYLEEMSLRFVTGNILWLTALFFMMYFLVPWKRAAAAVFLTLCLGFGAGNYYVGQFRGNPLMPGDLFSAGTAVQVAKGYSFVITQQVLTGVLCWYAGIALLCCLPAEQANKGWRIRATAAGLAVCVSMHHLGTVEVEDAYHWQLDQWNVGSSYQSVGSVFGFTALIEKMSVSAPQGYSTRQAEQLLEQYQPVPNTSDHSPSILVIMDETFSDLRILGNFSCSEEYLQNWYAMDDYVYRGKLYVSVFGGCTANSEYEFFTGASMSNHPPGIVPYQNYNLKHVGNLADLLRERGYRTSAVHPQQKGNWNRVRTYADFGFTSFYGLEDFKNPRYLRGHVSDQSDFDKVIELFESGQGEPQFIFNVTMQNHGGYQAGELSDLRTVTLDEPWDGYPDVETYLTLIRESDQAICRLVDYFSKVEEPVVLCIFGDHLPNLDHAWMEQVMGRPDSELSLEEIERKYAVPYLIWTNFQTADRCRELDTSANYLGALLLTQAGVRPSAYTSYLLHMQKEIPVINAAGYRTNDGQWHAYGEQTDASDWLERYRMLQYYAVFDSDREIRYFR